MSLQDILNAEDVDSDLVPRLIPTEAKLGFRASVSEVLPAFERASAILPSKELISGSAFIHVTTVAATTDDSAKLYISATDGEQTVRLRVDNVLVSTEGSALLPGKKFIEILKLAPTEDVRIEVVGDAATIRSGNAVWTLTVPFNDFAPPLPDTDSIALESVSGDAMMFALYRVIKAVSTTAARLPLMQCNFQDGYVRACDSARLHQQKIKGLNPEVEFSLPLKAMNELVKSLKAHRPRVLKFGYDDTFIFFEIENDLMVVQRISLPFPNTDSVLLGPRVANDKSLTFNRLDLMDAVKSVRVTADPDEAAVYLTVAPTKQGPILAVRAQDRDGNKSQAVLKAQWEYDKPEELAFNHRYLLELLGSYTETEVTLVLGESTKNKKAPALLEDKGTGFSAVLQQMKPYTV